MRISGLLAAAAFSLTFAMPAAAEEPAKGVSASTSAVASVLADKRRDADRARDQYRHPAETLAFFQVEPQQTVAEYAPGGGWYTRVIAPYVGHQGKYVALNFGPSALVPEGYHATLEAFPNTFPAKVVEETGVPAANVSAYTTEKAPESLNGTIDRVLIMRMMHNLRRWNIADSELAAIRRLLKDDGLVGIVQHQAPEDETWARSNGNRGYLKKSDVVAMMHLAGFELVDESDINANPADDASYEKGVWSLPPTYALGEQDRDKYAAIGESNRMTLLFRKAD
ncbi:MAG: methyltransferase [Caenibius sp.]